jgi:hypothetical protein
MGRRETPQFTSQLESENKYKLFENCFFGLVGDLIRDYTTCIGAAKPDFM